MTVPHHPVSRVVAAGGFVLLYSIPTLRVCNCILHACIYIYYILIHWYDYDARFLLLRDMLVFLGWVLVLQVIAISPEKKHPAMQCKRCCVSENCLANDIDVEQGALFFVRFVQVLSWHRIVFSCNYLINFKTLSHVFLSVLFSFVRTVEKIMCWKSNCASRLLYSRL